MMQNEVQIVSEQMLRYSQANNRASESTAMHSAILMTPQNRCCSQANNRAGDSTTIHAHEINDREDQDQRESHAAADTHAFLTEGC
jgi:hypothetical protein